MDVFRDYYAILGVAADATQDDIKSAYRRAARRLHPDANVNPGAATQFADIAEAYEVLGQSTTRHNYDLQLRRLGLPPAYYSLRVTPSKRVLRCLDEPQVMYALLEITPNPLFTRDEGTSIPLNLSIVIDRSTSMTGQRLDKVKQAAHRIIDMLDEIDFLSFISFSDRAETIFEAVKVIEKPTLKAMVSTIQASGGTEIFQGLQAGVQQVRRNHDRRYVNHVILLTDGQTYGDEDLCIELAEEIAREGIGISTVGIGQEWNDEFLDDLASKTGGSSTYINTPAAIVKFMNEKVRSLGSAFAERLQLSIAPDTDVSLEDAFKLTPNPQPLPKDLAEIPLGSLDGRQSINVIMQLQLPALPNPSFRSTLRLDVTGDIMIEGHYGYKALSDFSIEVSHEIDTENPPMVILEALGKLTLYRMQEKAQAAVSAGDAREATRRLQNLATRLLENGQDDLANAAIAEAQRVTRTAMLSEEGQKTLKYGTRALLLPTGSNGP